MKTLDYIIRVSALGDRDADATLTIPEQEAKCLAEITRKGAAPGLKIDAVDTSGGVVIDSKPYQLALQRVRDGKSAGMVVAYSSRFARNWMAVGRFLEQLKDATAGGGELWFADRPDVDYRTPHGAMMVSMDSVANANYLAETKSKAEHTLTTNILVRGIPSQCPIGYRRHEDDLSYDRSKCQPNPLDARYMTPDPKALTPDPATADLVRQAFQLRADGVSWVSIAQTTGLTMATIRSIISNPVYTGIVQYQRREHRRGAKTGDVLRKDNCHEPLVSVSLWKAAQSAKTVQRSGTYTAGVAGGLLVCGSCGGKLAVAGSAGNLTYGCRRQRHGGKCAAPMFVTKGRADAFIIERVTDRLAEVQAKRGDGDQLAKLRSERDAAQIAFDTALERSLMLSDPDKARTLLRRVEASLEAAQSAVEAAEERAEVMDDLTPSVELFLGLDADHQRRIARAVISSVEVGARVTGTVEDAGVERAPVVEDRFAVSWR